MRRCSLQPSRPIDSAASQHSGQPPPQIGAVARQRAVVQHLPPPADGNGPQQQPLERQAEHGVAALHGGTRITQQVRQAYLPLPGMAALAAQHVGKPHRRADCACCGKRGVAAAPARLEPGPIFGRSVAALVVCLHHAHTMSMERLRGCWRRCSCCRSAPASRLRQGGKETVPPGERRQSASKACTRRQCSSARPIGQPSCRHNTWARSRRCWSRARCQ